MNDKTESQTPDMPGFDNDDQPSAASAPPPPPVLQKPPAPPQAQKAPPPPVNQQAPPEAPPEAPPPVSAAEANDLAHQQAQQQAEAQSAAEAFANTKADRIRQTVDALARLNITYDASYIASLPSVRDAMDEVALTAALSNTMATLQKRAADHMSVGGDGSKPGMVLAGGTAMEKKRPPDEWKCPKCGAINEMQFLNDETQHWECCPMCSTAVRRDLAHNLHRVVRDDKTLQELQAEGA